MKNLPNSLLKSYEIYTTSCRINEGCKLSTTGDRFIDTLCINIDQARDNAFIDLRDYASSFSHSSDTVKAVAGRNLATVFDTAGNKQSFTGIRSGNG